MLPKLGDVALERIDLVESPHDRVNEVGIMNRVGHRLGKRKANFSQ
jgi:hypothetical protein